MVVADLGEPRKLTQAWVEARWPIYAKLHGDYHSENLKNTAVELQKQDHDMRQGLVDACRANGLAVVGYSGRDVSIINSSLRRSKEAAAIPAACSGSRGLGRRCIRR